MERASSRQLQQNSFTSKGSGGKLRRNKSHAELHSAKSSWSQHIYPCSAADYELEKEVGKGACGTVWLATCKANGDQVALKILELDNMSVDLDTIRRETQIMAEMRHPNVMPLFCSFVHKEQLWMVMPYISGGSIFSIMLNQHPNGLEEEMVATIALDVLRGLEYMHSHSMLHRDVKAANVLINHDGRVVLSDFGVTANLERAATSTRRFNSHVEASTSDAAESPSSAGGSCGGSGSGSGHFQSAWAAQKYLARNTFCGTPCFMAPEVMQQTQGYDLAADVWSFGILLEELTLGRAPYANMSLTSVILTTLHQDAPTLNAQKTRRKFCEELHDIVKQCLQKDPALRPITSQLLKHKFFKNAEDAAYLVKYLLNGSTGTPMKDMLRTVTRTFRSKPIDKKTVSQRNLNVYATAHLSGDVANAVTLLKRMTRPSSRKHKAGLLIPSTDIAACQGVCFTVLRKSKAGLGVDCVRGHGFCVARRPLKPVTPRKTFMHWASVDTFRPGLSVLDAGLPRKDLAEDKEERQEWTAPCYFDISIMGCGDSFGEEDFVEAVILLPDQATVDVFRKGEGALEQTAAHDSASSFTGPASTCKAYAIADDSIFNLCLNGARIQENSGANTRVFGGQVITPAEVLSGKMMPPHEFQVLYKLLSSLCAEVHCDQPGPHMDRSKPGATALCRMEERGSTLMYRMPIWLYDDDD